MDKPWLPWQTLSQTLDKYMLLFCIPAWPVRGHASGSIAGQKAAAEKAPLRTGTATGSKLWQKAVQSYTTPPRKPSAVQTVSALKERDFQRKHALKRKAEALADGLLLPDEVTEDVRTEAVRVAKTNKQADQQRAKKRRDYELGGHLTFNNEDTRLGLPGSDWPCLVLSEIGAARGAPQTAPGALGHQLHRGQSEVITAQMFESHVHDLTHHVTVASFCRTCGRRSYSL